MAVVNKVGGTAFVKVDGEQLMLRGDLTISPDNIERKGVAGQDSVHGYTEEPRVPTMKMTVTDRGTVSLTRILGWTNVSVTAELMNLKTFVGRNGFTLDARELNTKEGSYEVTFGFLKIEELVAAA
jgi:Phage tail tube protein